MEAADITINWFRVIAAVSVGLGVLGTILFTHVIGAALYSFVRRPQRRAEVAS